MDKNITELEKAIKEANIIPKEYRDRIAGFTFLGAVQGPAGNVYYYYDKGEDRYYCETDFDREMRAIIKKNKIRKYGKI